MLSLAHHYDEPVATASGTYRARVYGQLQTDGMWGGWLVFFPLAGGRVISTERETTQSSLADLSYWASGLSHSYLHGALERALALQPEAQLARELDELDRLEVSAEARADRLEAAASLARAESRAAEAARDATEEQLLGAVAEAAGTEADAHERAAARSRKEAEAADSALKALKRKRSSSKTSSKKSRK